MNERELRLFVVEETTARRIATSTDVRDFAMWQTEIDLGVDTKVEWRKANGGR